MIQYNALKEHDKINPRGNQGISINSGRIKKNPELKNLLSILQQQASCFNCNDVF